MKKSVKILALLLTLILALSAFSVLAFASAAPDASAGENASENTEENVEEMKPIEVKFTTKNFLPALNYLWQGMLCIFIVIGVLVLVTYGLNKASNAIAAKASQKNDNE